MKTIISQRERFLRTMRYEPTDARPLHLVDVWPDTLARWRREGLPAGVDPHRYLGVEGESLKVFNVNYAFGVWPPFETRELERTAEFTVSIDDYGRTVRYYVDAARKAIAFTAVPLSRDGKHE